MRIYVDTSVLMTAHTREPHADLAQAWLVAQSSGGLILSTWALVKCGDAVAIKRRHGEIDADGQAGAIADVSAFTARFSPFIAPMEEDYQRARTLCRHAASGLRAGDALHFAMTLRWDITHFATPGRVLATNALAHGLATPVMPPSTGA